MHTQRRYGTCLGMSKKRERKENIAPYPKRKKKRDGAYKGVHTPSTKNISTHLHILIKVYDLFLLLDPIFDLAKYEKQVCLQTPPYLQLHKNKPLEIG